MAFSQAVSGLNAASTNLDVIGNNIANSATYGFKSGSVSFADMFAGSKAGLGVKVAGITQDFGDGVTTNTGRKLDVAISQNGFFRLVDSNGGVFYSRNGQLKLDANSNLVNMQGMQITGYPATGTPPVVQQGADPIPLTIPTAQMPASKTTSANFVMNLNSADDVPAQSPFDPANSSTFNKAVPLTVYDSLGNEHNLKLYYVKTADNKWDIYNMDTSVGGATPTTPLTSLSFNDSGALTGITNASPAGSQQVPVAVAALNGSAAFSFSMNVTGTTQQNSGANVILTSNQNGYKPGDLVGYEVTEDGSLVGNYSNEKSQLLGQIVLANFANPEGLSSQGDNVWSASTASGVALLGSAGTGNFGKLTSGALEASNVDLSKELVNMIVAQRNYQSNAQTIKTQDQILNTLVNLR
ncbi:flagellar hook protein FlgE [Cronobacter dublinensis]|uniref:Flagellar hook protein FlgE n=1 Tax=Cronobacter dublinensis TaxID=413497 RepID=A0A9Q4T826_9ENTR|nr:flagellar hook protein FlgE [Cronobacter dublinensis]EKF2278892.1 flagellar hook protein FlgE [Cronobacter dublinensis]EKF2292983.1 flagellar hook protein FlgE [Cronobacter dublinensis]EKF2296310.1 flagellar hook protein FlgE [Cronobacter dublinensis]EKK5267542.1 flagellar hook protein FlgE [Cronobacter dublinensis]EKK7716040.1 flagellar hook protein FlgE [Cronobacter dublinensis]